VGERQLGLPKGFSSEFLSRLGSDCWPLRSGSKPSPSLCRLRAWNCQRRGGPIFRNFCGEPVDARRCCAVVLVARLRDVAAGTTFQGQGPRPSRTALFDCTADRNLTGRFCHAVDSTSGAGSGPGGGSERELGGTCPRHKTAQTTYEYALTDLLGLPGWALQSHGQFVINRDEAGDVMVAGNSHLYRPNPPLSRFVECPGGWHVSQFQSGQSGTAAVFQGSGSDRNQSRRFRRGAIKMVQHSGLRQQLGVPILCELGRAGVRGASRLGESTYYSAGNQGRSSNQGHLDSTFPSLNESLLPRHEEHVH
jgi:hypothetical protein